MSSLLFNFLFDFFLFCFPVLFIARNKKKFELKKILAELGIKNPAPGFFFKKTTILFLQLFAVSIALSIATANSWRNRIVVSPAVRCFNCPVNSLFCNRLQ